MIDYKTNYKRFFKQYTIDDEFDEENEPPEILARCPVCDRLFQRLEMEDL